MGIWLLRLQVSLSRIGLPPLHFLFLFFFPCLPIVEEGGRWLTVCLWFLWTVFLCLPGSLCSVGRAAVAVCLHPRPQLSCFPILGWAGLRLSAPAPNPTPPKAPSPPRVIVLLEVTKSLFSNSVIPSLSLP